MDLNQVVQLKEQMDANMMQSSLDTPIIPATPAKTDFTAVYRRNGKGVAGSNSGEIRKNSPTPIPGGFVSQILDINKSLMTKSFPAHSGADFSHQNVGKVMLFNDPSVIQFTPLSFGNKDQFFPPKLVLLSSTNQSQNETAWRGASEMICTPLDPVTPFKHEESCRGSVQSEVLGACCKNRESDEAQFFNSNSSWMAPNSDDRGCNDERQKCYQQPETVDLCFQYEASNKDSNPAKHRVDQPSDTEFSSYQPELKKEELRQTRNTESVRTVSQNTKRKKIRARVIREGTARKIKQTTPKQVTPKPVRKQAGKVNENRSGTSSELPQEVAVRSYKRKRRGPSSPTSSTEWTQETSVRCYKRKKRSVNSFSTPTEVTLEPSASTSTPQTVNDNKFVRRKLNFDFEERPVIPEDTTDARASNYQDTGRCNVSSTCSTGSGMQASKELMGNSSSHMVSDLHHSRNELLEEYINQLQDPVTPSRREKLVINWKHLARKAGNLKSLDTLNTTENNNLPEDWSINRAQEGNLMCEYSAQCREDHSTSLVADFIRGQDSFKTYKRRRTQGKHSKQSILVKQFSNLFGNRKEQNLAPSNISQAQSFTLASELCKKLRRKRSTRKKIRKCIVTATNYWNQLLLTPVEQPPLCLAALSADNSLKIKTKRRTRQLLKPLSNIDARYFIGRRPGLFRKSSRGLHEQIYLRFNTISMQEPFGINNAIGAIVPYSSRNELVLHQRQLNLAASRQVGMVPYRGIEKNKEKKTRAKVDLDMETKRVFDLLMWKNESNEEDKFDADKEKHWQEEREIFRGRVDLFISRMHLIQGDRRFSKWKGSVLDSVVGVFLTQNVTDNLSSSAFMALAAKFPLSPKTSRSEFNASSIRKTIEYNMNMSSDGASLQEEKASENDDPFSPKSSYCQASESDNQLNMTSDECEDVDIKDLQVNGLGNETSLGKQNNISNTSETVKRYLGTDDNDALDDSVLVDNYITISEPFLDEFKLLLEPSTTKLDESGQLSLVNSQTPLLTECLENAQNITTQDENILRNNTSISPMKFDALCQTCEHINNCTVTPNGLENKQSSNQKSSCKNSYQLTDYMDSFSSLFTSPSTTSTLDEIDYSRLVREKSNVHFPQSNNEISVISTAEIRCKSYDEHSTSVDDFADVNGANFERRESTALPQVYNTGPAFEFIDQDDQTKSQERLYSWNDTGETIGDIMVTEPDTRGQNSNPENASSKVVKGKPKSKKGKAKKEAQEFDWDSLRKEACQNDCAAERSIETMDSLDWEAVRCASVDKISEAIQERGMNNVLAGRIKDFLNRVKQKHGSLDLEWLRNVPPDKTKDYLLSIRGLGLKSVECVRLLTLDQHAFPVDTNVGRICVRLGWVPIEPLPEEIQFYLVELYPVQQNIQKYLWPRLCKLDKRTLYELHYQMITFGKVFCTKRKPNCNACPLKGECKHFASAFASVRLALPGPENENSASASSQSADGPILPLTQEVTNIQDSDRGPVFPLLEDKVEERVEKNYAPVVEYPSSPEPVAAGTSVGEIEDTFFEDPDEIPEIKLNVEEFKRTLQNFMEKSKDFQDGDIEKALVAVSRGVASIPVPPLKYVSRLRTEHQAYELPDDHPLLKELDQRERDDPCPYLLIIWTPGEMADSIRKPETCCDCEETGKLCNNKECFGCSAKLEEQAQVVRGTLLIPCRTAMRGSFPLNGTYFQVNEVFADHTSSYDPILVPRSWIWNLQRRAVTMGTGTSAIFAGRSVEEIQSCFRKGFICIRGFERKSRAPMPLAKRLHYAASRVAKKRGKTATGESSRS